MERENTMHDLIEDFDTLEDAYTCGDVVMTAQSEETLRDFMLLLDAKGYAYKGQTSLGFHEWSNDQGDVLVGLA